MKRLLTAFAITIILAGCGIFGNDGSTRFGAWEKVSDDRGEYRGIDSQGKALAKVNTASMADTVQVDTSYVNSDKRLNLSITPHSASDAINDFYVTFVDSFPPGYDYYQTTTKYLTDSTSLVYTGTTNGSNNADRIRRESLFQNSCTGQQADKEHLIFTITNRDSSKITVYDIRVDGMKDIVSDIVECN